MPEATVVTDTQHHPEIVLPAPLVGTLRSHLLQDDGRERAVFVACTRIYDGNRYCAIDMKTPIDEEMATLEPVACRPSNEVERQFLSRCQVNDLHPVIIHSHPFDDLATFSSQDYQAMNRFVNWLTDFHDSDILFGVVGQDNLRVERYDPGSDQYERLPATVIGEWLLDTPLVTDPVDTAATEDSTADSGVEVDRQWYDRNIRVFGGTAQQRLAEATVAVVGCGGIGSFLVEELARVGTGRLVLIDPDDTEVSNLPRLIGAKPGDVGESKVRIMQEIAYRANPDIEVTTVHAGVGTDSAMAELEAADVIVSGVDQTSARYLLNEYAVRTFTPWVDAGTRIETESDSEQVDATTVYVQTVVPGGTACFDCLNRGNDEDAYREQMDEEELRQQVERGYIDETALSPAPAVIMPNGVAASIAVDAVVKLLTGYDAPPALVRYDLTTHDHAMINTSPRTECPTCGNDKVTGCGAADLTADTVIPEIDGAGDDIQDAASEAAIDPETITVRDEAEDEPASEIRSIPQRVTAYFERLHPL